MNVNMFLKFCFSIFSAKCTISSSVIRLITAFKNGLVIGNNPIFLSYLSHSTWLENILVTKAFRFIFSNLASFLSSFKSGIGSLKVIVSVFTLVVSDESLPLPKLLIQYFDSRDVLKTLLF